MPLPQIQLMPRINQVRELYIQAMKCGDVGERMYFIYFFEEWPERTYLDVVHCWHGPGHDPFFPTKIPYKSFLDDTGHMSLYPDTGLLL
jgi:hypothetical protein